MLSDRGTVLLLYSNYNTIATMEVFLSFQLSCDRGHCTVLFFPTTRQSQPHCYFFHIQLSCDRGHCAIFFSYQTIEATVLFIFIPTTTQSRPQCHILFISTYHTIEGTVLFLLFPPSITIQSRSRSYFFSFPTTIRSWPQCYVFCFSVQLPCDHIHGISLF